MYISLVLSALFNSLDPESLTQACAYYELYPETEEGQKALKRAKNLLKAPDEMPVEWLVNAIHRFPTAPLEAQQIEIIDSLAATFPNRKLKGYHVETEEELLKLDSSEIDLSKALLILQTKGKEEIKNYLALLDLMTLQVLSRLPPNATHKDKIKEMNRFIFQELRFRFPPHSIYAKKIDTFTFLPSVMDNHIGVCLGVTTLYLSLSQRLDLPLEIMTPPGHIFVRYRDGDEIVNIETTARGVNLPNEHYETIRVKKALEPRELKEVIGMTFINKASIFWEEGSYDKAVTFYEKALPYLKNDPLTKELLAYSYIVSGQPEKGEKLLKSIENDLSDIGEDVLAKKVAADGLKAIFCHVDETRESIIAKKEELLKVMKEFPLFRTGLEQMAVCYLQLHRPKEAISWLLKYHEIDRKNGLIEYYLASLHAERQDFENAWAYLKNAEETIKERSPKALKELKDELACHLPEPKTGPNYE